MIEREEPVGRVVEEHLTTAFLQQAVDLAKAVTSFSREHVLHHADERDQIEASGIQRQLFVPSRQVGDLDQLDLLFEAAIAYASTRNVETDLVRLDADDRRTACGRSRSAEPRKQYVVTLRRCDDGLSCRSSATTPTRWIWFS
jgi:hypothetical protein